jgi:hypothetical protein
MLNAALSPAYRRRQLAPRYARKEEPPHWLAPSNVQWLSSARGGGWRPEADGSRRNRTARWLRRAFGPCGNRFRPKIPKTATMAPSTANPRLRYALGIEAASVGGLFHRGERNPMAGATSHPAMQRRRPLGKCNNLSSGVWYRTDKTIIVAIGFRHHRPVLGSFR